MLKEKPGRVARAGQVANCREDDAARASEIPAFLLTKPKVDEIEELIARGDDLDELAENPSLFNLTIAALRYGRDLPAIERPRRPLWTREEVARLVARLAADVLRARRPGDALARMARAMARHVEHEVGLEDCERAIEAVGLAGGVDFPAIDRALHQLWVSA